MQLIKLYLFAMLIFLAFAVAACGQTGDLYLPEEDPKQKSKDKSEA
jgi:predicted small lipoprotein YifL